MKISVVTPVLNEIRFIKGWHKNVIKFADEIVVVDTGSTDGTYEYLLSQPDIYVKRWDKIYAPYCWPEHEIRNWLLKTASGDWIVPLDVDEMVSGDFIENLNSLSTAKWLIGRFICLQFWNDYKHLRVRELWPPIKLLKARSSVPLLGIWRLGALRNWRGWYPNKFPRVCKRDDRIRYGATGNHCILQYRNYGRLSYYLPSITKNFDIGLYHFHFTKFGKSSGNRNADQFKDVKIVEYSGIIPDEVKYYR